MQLYETANKLRDGVTSTVMQLKLLNVARSSLQELREDFEDYIMEYLLRGRVRTMIRSNIVTGELFCNRFVSVNSGRKIKILH